MRCLHGLIDNGQIELVTPNGVRTDSTAKVRFQLFHSQNLFLAVEVLKSATAKSFFWLWRFSKMTQPNIFLAVEVF